MRFSAPASGGASRGPLAGWQGAHLGINARGIVRGPGGASAEAGFAVLIETVMGPGNGSGNRAPGSDAAPQMGAIRLDREAPVCARRVLSHHS